jgi:hypothetical protein
MFAFDAGTRPASLVRAVAAPFLALALAMCQAGCASGNAVTYAKAPVVAAYSARAPHVAAESDGLPSQPPPQMRIHKMPDYPTEPYSPNYGGPNPAAVAREPAKASSPVQTASAAIPGDLPRDFRARLVAEVERAE